MKHYRYYPRIFVPRDSKCPYPNYIKINKKNSIYTIKLFGGGILRITEDDCEYWVKYKLYRELKPEEVVLIG